MLPRALHERGQRLPFAVEVIGFADEEGTRFNATLLGSRAVAGTFRKEVLDAVDRTSPYALTGALFARDRAALSVAASRLRHAAGNLYLNDKPTGAVVGQQPFGGARASGTNDKAGSPDVLRRFTSPRTLKEEFFPLGKYTYPSNERA